MQAITEMSCLAENLLTVCSEYVAIRVPIWGIMLREKEMQQMKIMCG